MNAHDAILLNITASGDRALGRTVLQKLIYFQTQLGVGIDAAFVPHFYGPFSKDVAAALAELVAFDYVNEYRSRKAFGYAYVLAEDGEDIANEAKGNNKKSFKKIKKVINTCGDCLNPGSLSYAAKVHYIQSRDKSFTPEDVASTFGWKMTDQDVRTGQKLLKKLHLD